jgi:START domain
VASPVLLLPLLALAAEWEEVGRDGDIVLEARAVKDSPHREFRATTTVRLGVEALCTAAYGSGVFDAREPGLKTRRVITTGDTEQIHYDQMTTPVVTDRDIVIRNRRALAPDGTCRVWVDAVKDPNAPLHPDYVRIDTLHASWLFEPLPDGQTHVTHLTWTDPKISLPVGLVEPTRRANTITWVKLVLQRAREAKDTVRR